MDEEMTPHTVQTSAHAATNKAEDAPVLSSQMASQTVAGPPAASATALIKRLSLLDRLLTPTILVCMIVGVVIGEFVPNVQKAFDTVSFNHVSVPIAVGLIVMMWPVLTKVQYESLPRLFTSRRLLYHILISLFLNWILAPFIMLGLAWATLPDLPTYRTGVILVGLARCIAMVMIWNQLAGGDMNYCAVLVVVNSGLQMVLYAPYAIWFINVIGGGKGQQKIHVSYRDVAISVLIYLGIPLALGILTRAVFLLNPRTRTFFHRRFLPIFSPLSLIGLLYTIIVMFAYQGHHIISNIRPVFRVFVPLILYFAIVWVMGFSLIYWLGKRNRERRRYAGMCACRGLDTSTYYPPEKSNPDTPQSSDAAADASPTSGCGPAPRASDSVRDETGFWGYDMAVVQAFTAGSNNFELAIAIAIAVYGVGSDQALAATIGPLVEVPVLLALTWVALWLGKRLSWDSPAGSV
ncbi:sodium bile acid symporter family-domain-containing protein [Cristinia sonorae]|uniref:Sodium bile acid symporter family-domain-containing protein n=1 Tax=Cristinia sonorae TaxID=1940300 RepID=A0A8K0UFA7_9AGAR|nr:sodium bile acid symporter family-domain-containing protein [Cristinia sonorae]